jgi:hypothetical protein
VVCDGVYPCHEAGYCDPALGQCVYPVLPDKTPCDDGDLCTEATSCKGGLCTGTLAVICPDSLGACYYGGTCDPASGECVYIQQPDGTSCDDGSTCTPTDTCQAGVCNPEADPTWAHWSPSAAKEYVVVSEHVVFDPVTMRTWQRAQQDLVNATWEQAQAYCTALSLPGFPSGWRLPTRIELISIVDYTRSNPAIDTEVFPGTRTGIYWTSSTAADGSGGYWWVDFNTGHVNLSSIDQVDLAQPRCVR